jgi:antitoxin VapB
MLVGQGQVDTRGHLEFSGKDAIIRKEGDRLIIEPVLPKSPLAVLATLVPLEDDFALISDLPPDPVDL